MMVERTKEVLSVVEETIEDGFKPSAKNVATKLDWPLQDIHRCLNILEKEGKISSYHKEVLGTERRMVSVKRS